MSPALVSAPSDPARAHLEDIVSRLRLPHFRIEEEADVDGALRLILVGELDIAAAGDLRECLWCLRTTGERVRLDLSELEFIDVCGFSVIRDAVEAGRSSNDGVVELAPVLSKPVRRLFDLLAAGSGLAEPASRSDCHRPRG